MAQIVVAEQRTEEWYKARLGKATASRFKDVLATTRSGYSASRQNYMAELVTEILTGQPASTYSSAAMEWGTETEPVARLEYTLETGNEVEETGFWLHEILPVGASPDGLVGEDGLIEIKCPNTATHIETLRTKKLPKQYVAQVQGQLWITDRRWGDFMSYDPRLPENAQKVIIRVERDDEFIQNLQAELEIFMREVEEQVNFVKGYKG